jgi:hypothetical protein
MDTDKDKDMDMDTDKDMDMDTNANTDTNTNINTDINANIRANVNTDINANANTNADTEESAATSANDLFQTLLISLILAIDTFSADTQLLLDFQPTFPRTLSDSCRLLVEVFVKNASNITVLSSVFAVQLGDGRDLGTMLIASLIRLAVLRIEPASSNASLTLLILISSQAQITAARPQRYFHELLLLKMEERDLAEYIRMLIETIVLERGTASPSYWNLAIASRPSSISPSHLSLFLFCALYYANTATATSTGTITGTPTDTTANAATGATAGTDNMHSQPTLTIDSKLSQQVLCFLQKSLSSYPQTLKLPEVCQVAIFTSIVVNFCPDFRSFLLSRLDAEELAVSMAKVVHGLSCRLRDRLKHNDRIGAGQEGQVEIVLACLGHVLALFTEDSTYLKQLFSCQVDRALFKWYTGPLNQQGSLGNFLFGILLECKMALASTEFGRLRDDLLAIYTSIVSNMSQYIREADRSLADLLTSSLQSALLRSDPQEQAHLFVELISLLTNALMNAPRDNCLLLLQLLLNDRYLFRTYMGSLTGILEAIDAQTNRQTTTRLDESRLVFASVVIGNLRFLQRLDTFLTREAWDPLNGLPQLCELIQTFPMPAMKRDASNEPWLRGTRARADPIPKDEWAKYIAEPVGWSLIYSAIPWKQFV